MSAQTGAIMVSPRSNESEVPGREPWSVAWTLLLPLAIWLLLAKAVVVMMAFDGLGLKLDGDGPTAVLKWLWAFTSLRFVFALLAAYAIQKIIFPRRRIVIFPIGAALMLAMALLVAALKPNQTTLQVLTHWGSTAAEQAWMLIACTWRDAISVAMLVLVFGSLLRFTSERAYPWMVRLQQVVVALLCGVVGLNLSYQLGTGQPISIRALIFSLDNWNEILPVISSEITPFRVTAIVGGVALGFGWGWHHRRLSAPLKRRALRFHRSWWVALAGSLAIFLPLPSVGYLPLERHTEAVLIGLAETAIPSTADEATAKVAREFDATRQPRWHSAGMTIAATEKIQRKNVVIVMLESVRAESTTLGNSALDTTPFLKRLSRDSLVVEDMSAVIPRTAAAWIAILAGQYPLTNEGTTDWATGNAKIPRLRGLPGVLRDAGYTTSFFTPTTLEFQSDQEVIHSLGFDFVSTEQNITYPGAQRTSSFGVADELMVQPILDWTAAQAKAHRPFMTAIMTNVGHHPYQTPSSWSKIKFDGVSDPLLESYYNCLRYIDSVLSNLMQGYEKLGVLNDTIFIVLGDHGQLFGEHGLKQTFNAIYQNGVHVPALIYAPGLALKPGIIRGPRQQIDVLPTVLDLLGYRLDGGEIPGTSMLNPVDPDRKLYYSSSIDWSFLAMREGQRKYIYSFGRNPMEVFDLASDPKELHPQSDTSGKKLAQVEQDLLEWRAHAVLSMNARPTDLSQPSGPWLKK